MKHYQHCGSAIANGMRWMTGIILSVLAIAATRADEWTYWGQVSIPNSLSGTAGAQMATDGTNMYYSTLLDGVWRASFDDHQFYPMPMTGFPLWNGATNPNGYAVWHLATTPQGTLIISGILILLHLEQQ